MRVRKIKGVLLGAVTAFALVAGMAGTAHATAEAGGIVFVGSATTGNLWSPASPNCAAGPAGTPVCPRNNVGWSFSSDIAAAASAGKKPTGIAGVLNADAAASISGSGTLEGWCGQSLGSGGGSVGASGKSYSFNISWVSGGSVLTK